MSPFTNVKYVFFDLMGTCLDWQSSIDRALPHIVPPSERSQFSLAWRQGFFREIHTRFEAGLPQEDIDLTHRRVLDHLLENSEWRFVLQMNDEERLAAVKAWHSMTPWADVAHGLARLRQHHETFVLANGTTRLQLDLIRSSGLSFDLLMSSELLGFTKPDLAIYRKAMQLVKASSPDECAMVAAHAYDLRAAQQVGMKTIYVQRSTEDTDEDMLQIMEENDAFIPVSSSAIGGLADLMDILRK